MGRAKPGKRKWKRMLGRLKQQEARINEYLDEVLNNPTPARTHYYFSEIRRVLVENGKIVDQLLAIADRGAGGDALETLEARIDELEGRLAELESERKIIPWDTRREDA